MTAREFAEKYTAEELKEISNDIAKTIVIRSYKNGSSSDDQREATLPEREILSKLIYAAFVAYGYRSKENGGSLDAVLDMAEFACHQFLPEANAYDSLYTPVKRLIEER